MSWSCLSGADVVVPRIHVPCTRRGARDTHTRTCTTRFRPPTQGLSWTKRGATQVIAGSRAAALSAALLSPSRLPSLSLSSYPSSSSSCRCIARAPLVTRRLAIEKERRKRKDLENLDLRATDQRFRRRLGSRSDGSSRCTSQAAAAAAAAATRVTRGLPPLLLLLSPVTAVE